MKVLIIGATGEAGSVITKEAIARKLEVIVYVRNPHKLIDNEHIKVLEGDILDYESLRDSMKEIEVVISCVGATNNEPGQIEIFETGMKNIIAAMNYNNVKRLISINGALTKLDTDQVGMSLKFMRWLIPKLVPEMIKSNKAQYDEIVCSNLDWTILRPGYFTDRESPKRITICLSRQNGFNIGVSKVLLADFVISQITDTTYFKKSPMLFSK